MYFNGKISVSINGIELKTIVSISATNDSQHIGADCSVVVPLNCRIEYKNGKHDYLTQQANVAFKSGDKISIKAWYEGFQEVSVFEGYVADFQLGNPTTIKCMDYIYHFNLGIFGNERVLIKKNKNSKKSAVQSIGCSFASITIKELLTKIIDFVNNTIDDISENSDHVELFEAVMEITLVNITFPMMSPAAILDYLKKNIGINISLTGNKLYCNIASNTLSKVKYSTDRNVLTSGLQHPDAVFTKYKVKAWFLRNDGTKDSVEVGDDSGQLKDVFFQ